MREILDFLFKHWQTSGLLFGLLVIYIWFEFKDSSNTKVVSAEQAIALYNHNGGMILDIRSEEDYKQGHITGAIWIGPEVETQIKKLEKYKTSPVIIVCAHGKTALKVAQTLRKSGFSEAKTLSGGIQAWQDLGLPLIK